MIDNDKHIFAIPEKLAYLDIISGIAFIIIGALASHNIIAVNGASYYIGFGSAQLALSLIFKLLSSRLHWCCPYLGEDQFAEQIRSDPISRENLAEQPISDPTTGENQTEQIITKTRYLSQQVEKSISASKKLSQRVNQTLEESEQVRQQAEDEMARTKQIINRYGFLFPTG